MATTGLVIQILYGIPRRRRKREERKAAMKTQVNISSSISFTYFTYFPQSKLMLGIVYHQEWAKYILEQVQGSKSTMHKI